MSALITMIIVDERLREGRFRPPEEALPHPPTDPPPLLSLPSTKLRNYDVEEVWEKEEEEEEEEELGKCDLWRRMRIVC